MSYASILSLLPFPFVLVCTEKQNIIYKNKNSFFEDSKNTNFDFLSKINNSGWFTCPEGFAVYSKKISSQKNVFLIFYGLKVRPFWKKQGKSNFFTVVSDQALFEKYIESSISIYSKALEEIEADKIESIRSFAVENIHEIRSINSSLYNVGFELQESLQYEKHPLALAKNIVALSELISSRIDLTDFSISENEDVFLKKSPPSPVFKIFDKLIRCFTVYALKRKISLKIEGVSRGQSLGLENFDLIPMILIDNAVKYSPNGKEIKIIFNEDSDYIKVNLISLGPKINEIEKSKIFENTYRGIEAIKSGKKGSGIGLYFVGRLMKIIDSKINVSQEEASFNIDRKTFHKTNFELVFRKTK